MFQYVMFQNFDILQNYKKYLYFYLEHTIVNELTINTQIQCTCIAQNVAKQMYICLKWPFNLKSILKYC